MIQDVYNLDDFEETHIGWQSVIKDNSDPQNERTIERRLIIGDGTVMFYRNMEDGSFGLQPQYSKEVSFLAIRSAYGLALESPNETYVRITEIWGTHFHGAELFSVKASKQDLEKIAEKAGIKL